MKNGTPKTVPKEKKLSAIPLRLEAADSDKLDQMSKRTGVPRAAIMRAAIRFMLPLFANGEVNILGLEAAGCKRPNPCPCHD